MEIPDSIIKEENFILDEEDSGCADTALTFPYKLFLLLELVDREKITPAPIQWNEDGKSFKVIRKDPFCDLVMPLFFKRKFPFIYALLFLLILL